MGYESDVLGVTPIHDWFSLTYSSYLILPRSILQAMPQDWQRKVLRLIEEVEDTLEYEGSDYEYMVKRRIGNGQFSSDPLANYRYPPLIQRKAKASE